MKINFLSLLLLISFTLEAQFAHQNINLLGNFDDSTVVAEPNHGIRYQGCWGWTDGNGKEYGIIGSTEGTYIIDVTNPANLIQCDYIPHHQTDIIWHEYKTYGNLLYIISDNAGTGFQIADLSYLPDSVHLIYDSIGLFEHAHTITIDQNKMYLGSVSAGFNFNSMDVYSLNDPAHPTLLRSLNQDYPIIFSVHDMFVMNDTVYASCGYDGLFIFRYDSVNNVFTQIATLPDFSNIYNHSSVLSPDHNVLYVCEELPDGRPIKIVDVRDKLLPEVDSTFFSHTGATPHNPEVIDNILYIAYYLDGVYAYDITDPFNPLEIGYFDTYYLNTPGNYPPTTYNGCWSTYGHLPSGNLLAGDTEFGLFVLDVSGLSTGIDKVNENNFNIYPNPAGDFIHVNAKKNSTIEILDMTGKILISKYNTTKIETSGLDNGMYLVRVSDNTGSSSRVLVVNSK